MSKSFKLDQQKVEEMFGKINLNFDIDNFVKKCGKTCVEMMSFLAKLFKTTSGYHTQKFQHLLAATKKNLSELQFIRLHDVLENLHCSRAQRTSNLCSNYEPALQLQSYLEPIKEAKYGHNS